jgi:hypothetical protein
MQIWKGALDYCIDFENWESGMILHRTECPANPFPMSEETAIHYMPFQTFGKGTVLKTNQPVLKNNIPVKCRGDWRSSATVGLYRAALSKVHKSYDTTRGDAPNVSRFRWRKPKREKVAHITLGYHIISQGAVSPPLSDTKILTSLFHMLKIIMK